jgi:hypothetical protein
VDLLDEAANDTDQLLAVAVDEGETDEENDGADAHPPRRWWEDLPDQLGRILRDSEVDLLFESVRPCDSIQLTERRRIGRYGGRPS